MYNYLIDGSWNEVFVLYCVPYNTKVKNRKPPKKARGSPDFLPESRKCRSKPSKKEANNNTERHQVVHHTVAIISHPVLPTTRIEWRVRWRATTRV